MSQLYLEIMKAGSVLRVLVEGNPPKYAVKKMVTKIAPTPWAEIKQVKNELFTLKESLKKIKTCPSCNKDVLDNFKICPYCGEALKLSPEKVIIKKL